jgi:hypothetical protein
MSQSFGRTYCLHFFAYLEGPHLRLYPEDRGSNFLHTEITTKNSPLSCYLNPLTSEDCHFPPSACCLFFHMVTTYNNMHNYKRFTTRSKIKYKTIHVTDRGGPYGYETSWLPHSLDNRLTDGGEVVNLTHSRTFTSRNMTDTHLC